MGNFQKYIYFRVAKPAEEKTNEQALCAIQVLCLTSKKILTQAIAHQKKIHSQPKGEKTTHAPENCPPHHAQKNNGPSLIAGLIVNFEQLQSNCFCCTLNTQCTGFVKTAPRIRHVA